MPSTQNPKWILLSFFLFFFFKKKAAWASQIIAVGTDWRRSEDVKKATTS